MESEHSRSAGDTTAVLLDVVQAAGSTLNLDEVLERVVERAAALTGADRSSIWLLEPDGERLVPVALYGMSPLFTAVWKRNSLLLREERLSLEALTTGSPVVVFDAARDARTVKEAVAFFDDKSILVVPLTSHAQAIGTLFINHVKSHHIYTDRDIQVTQGIASQAAIAIESARLSQRSREMSVELLASFRRIGEALAAGLDLTATLQTIVTLATEMVHARAGLGALVGEAGELSVQATYGDDADLIAASAGARLVAGRVVATGLPVSLDDVPIAQADGRAIGRSSAWSSIAVPMRLRGVILGVLSVFYSTNDRLSEQAVDILGSFANHAALAIENAGLFAALRAQVTELSDAVAQNATLYGALEQEKERLLAVIQNSSDAIYMVDAEHRVVTFNPAAEALIGCAAEDVVGRSSVLFANCQCQHETQPSGGGQHEADAALVGRPCPVVGVLRTGRSIPYIETSITTCQHEVKEVAASYSYVPAAGNAGPFVLVIGRDITRLREVERLKSDFVSVVSHELRTPLAVIKGYAATLLNPQVIVDRERELRFIKGINDASDRLTRLIDNVLSVSRFESGRFKLNLQSCDLRDTILKVANTFRQASHRHQIIVSGLDAPLGLRADRDQMEQVLSNLVSNAIKYSPDGGEIRLSGRATANGVEIAVADQGIGIAESQLATVFDKFYRADSRTSRSVTGVGLGLYICRTVVEAHGGRIWVESEVGSGSTFRILIPREPEPAGDETHSPMASTPAGIRRPGDSPDGAQGPNTGS